MKWGSLARAPPIHLQPICAQGLQSHFLRDSSHLATVRIHIEAARRSSWQVYKAATVGHGGGLHAALAVRTLPAHRSKQLSKIARGVCVDQRESDNRLPPLPLVCLWVHHLKAERTGMIS